MLTTRSTGLFRSIVISFLERHEANGTQLKNCPAQIHEWILGQQNRRPTE
jgi:hypothetical protein